MARYAGKILNSCLSPVFLYNEIPSLLGNKLMGLFSEQNIFFGNKPMDLCANKIFFVL